MVEAEGLCATQTEKLLLEIFSLFNFQKPSKTGSKFSKQVLKTSKCMQA